MSNPFQLQFSLRQHTPIIHFQHDQDGATLRASEVKPKLDKYIIEQRGGWGNIETGWRVGKAKVQDGQQALDYKIKVEAIGKPSYYIISSNPASPNRQQRDGTIKQGQDPHRIAKAISLNAEYINQTQYFADNQYINKANDDWKEVRRGVLYDENKVTIEFSNLSLRNEVEKHLQAFFFLHNFGTRQSKGFGCYTMERFEEAKHLPSGYAIYKKTVTGDWKSKARVIADDWKKLKAGNSYGTYYKSDLMKYFCKLANVRWEKRKIKREIKAQHNDLYTVLRKNRPVNSIAGCVGDDDNPGSVPASQNYNYIRAVLGLAEQFEYGLERDSQGRNSAPAHVKVSNDEIKRFKAPVTFKVIGDVIYMICYSVPTELSDGGSRAFNFDLSAKHDGNNYRGGLAQLTVPTHFNVCHFFDSPWLGNNFELERNWGDYTESGKPKAKSVAQNLNYQKIHPNA